MPSFVVSFRRLAQGLILGCLVISVSACSSMGFNNLFSGYAEQLKTVRMAQLNGDFSKAANLVEVPKNKQTNYSLSLLEKARLHYLAQDWAQSRQEFTLVSTELEQEQAKAKLRLSDGLANMTALVSSDNAIAYDIPAYEQTMLHSYQALNYVFLGQLAGALVEVRRANLVQENALKQHQQSIDKAAESVDKNALKQTYPSMAAMIGDIKNGFQNAYTFYLSGVLYEAAKQPNDAYIDYKRALEIYPNNVYLQQDVLRLATQLQMVDDLALFTPQYGDYLGADKTEHGELVVLLERGVINAKQEVAIDLPLFTSSYKARFFSFALPVYQGSLAHYPKVSITAQEQRYEAEPIARLQSLASKQLQEQLPAIVTRQALRIIAKEKLRSTMSKEGGDLGNILATLYNITSEQADTRSWLTLPDEMQIMRLSLPAGQHQLSLNIGGKTQDISVAIKPGRISLMNLTTIENVTSQKVTQL
ncbi:MAG: hypothetical protein NWQ54_19610 [Paraglaciecola sp.]|nr:hypothetical protein [Paraglaciecola sp.]